MKKAPQPLPMMPPQMPFGEMPQRPPMPPGEQPPADKSRARYNPLPMGPQGLKILRGLSDCELSVEGGRLGELVDKLLAMPEEDLDDEVFELVGKATARSMRADTLCSRHLAVRTAAIFEEDDELQKVNAELKEANDTVQRLQVEITEALRRVGELTAERWGLSVEKFGLNPDQRSYRINEEKGVVEQVDFRCNECKARTIVRKTRQEIAERLLRIEGKKREDSNDGTGEAGEDSGSEPQGSGEGGEAVVPE